MDTTKFETMERVAEKLFRAGVFSAEVKNPDTAFAIILAGDELGFDPMASARNIALVKGKVSLSADAMVGLVKRSSVCAAWHVVDSTATECTITTTRHGDATPTVLTYTIAMAQRAGLTGSQTWRAHPEAMLRARCGAALARAVYPDVCGGLYEPDEAEEIRRHAAPVREEVPDVSLAALETWRETLADVAVRVDRVIGRARAADGDVAVFAHGHVLRVLTARWCDLAPVEGRRFVLDPATLSILGWERENAAILRWNLR